MKKIWAVRDAIPTVMRLDPPTADLGLVGQLFCRILNGAELKLAEDCGGRERTKPFPVAKIAIKIAEFDWDFFTCEGRMFVSERMRQVMALDPTDVRYFDVDATTSPAAVRSMNYQIMEPTVSEAVVDPSVTKAEWARYVADSIAAEEAGVPAPTNGVKIRKGAAPAHDLFYDAPHGRLFCTDAFALRVLKAGIIDMCFPVPSHMHGANVRYRTLQGIEEYVGWDEEANEPILRLVETLD